MKLKLINSQLSNFATYEMYKRQCLTLAENVFEFVNLPNYIDTAYLNKQLLIKGSIAFFVDEVMGLLALPYVNLSSLDVYGRPRKIQVIGKNGYNRILNRHEFVIMYDNNGRYPIYLDILQYAERLALDTRTEDINIYQQRTPRIFKVKQELEKSFKDMLNNIDGFEESISTYEEINLDDMSVVLSPAPYVADKVSEHKDKIWNEFLRLIGVSNLSYVKKERNIRDEISAMQGGTVASRYSRFEPRQKAIEEINRKFKDYLEDELEVRYYDGLPNSEKEIETNLLNEDLEESEVDENV